MRNPCFQANSLNGNITVDPLDKLYLNTIGQEHGLSFLDAKTLNLAYCAGTRVLVDMLIIVDLDAGMRISSACRRFKWT